MSLHDKGGGCWADGFAVDASVVASGVTRLFAVSLGGVAFLTDEVVGTSDHRPHGIVGTGACQDALSNSNHAAALLGRSKAEMGWCLGTVACARAASSVAPWSHIEPHQLGPL